MKIISIEVATSKVMHKALSSPIESARIKNGKLQKENTDNRIDNRDDGYFPKEAVDIVPYRRNTIQPDRRKIHYREKDIAIYMGKMRQKEDDYS